MKKGTGVGAGMAYGLIRVQKQRQGQPRRRTLIHKDSSTNQHKDEYRINFVKSAGSSMVDPDSED
jgi:hypothetical protein